MRRAQGAGGAWTGNATQMILYTYTQWLVVLSVVIALMSSFTGLSLTRGLSELPVGARQARIAMAAIALGGGIWSMHFVAILAMRFNVPVYFELIETVASALIAILLAGLSLLIMHFGRRTRAAIGASGTILGVGIVAMHYVGLSAIEGCVPVYRPAGVVLASVLAVGMGVAAIGIAYGRRSERNILLATLVFGAAVAVVHFTAMGMTDFLPGPALNQFTPLLANAQVAVLVLLAAFVISGAFLLSGASFMNRRMLSGDVAPPAPAPQPVPLAQPALPPPPPEVAQRLPFERDGRTHLVPVEAVSALRAEGHYTTAFLDHGAVFCPWSITQAEERLPPGFMRVHRSWIVNLAKVAAYERAKDHGYCVFAGLPGLERVPVARTRISALREALGL